MTQPIILDDFNFEVPVFSPVFGDDDRVVKYGENGEEIITYLPTDYKKMQRERGVVSQYSLDALLAAGLDPAYPVRTGNVSRVESLGVLQNVRSDVDKLFTE